MASTDRSHTADQFAKLGAPTSVAESADRKSPQCQFGPPIAKSTAPMEYDTWRKLLRDERLPAVVVDLNAFDRNVAYFASVLKQAGHGHRLRLATKSVRVPELIARVLAYGPPYCGLMCYSAEEAVFLADLGFDDLLIAYPTRQESDLRILREAHARGRRIRLMIDSVDGAEVLSKAMNGLATPFPVTLDVDMSLRFFWGKVHLGVRRSPLRSAQEVLNVFERISAMPGIEPIGLMGYEAQVAGLGDSNPFKGMANPMVRWVRRRSIRAVADQRRAIAETLTERGFSIEIFNGGGTGSAPHAVHEPWLTELTVGSGFLCSHLFSYYSDVPIEPACFFALQTVRSSDPGYVTCHGGGYIASGEPGWEKVPVPHLPLGVRLVSMEGCGEVQTPLIVEKNSPLKMGDPVLFRHAKAGELAEHFNDYLLFSNGQVLGRVPTYRGLGYSFLG
ncbi:MAG: alanine racemase [Planctomycetota bacterium]